MEAGRPTGTRSPERIPMRNIYFWGGEWMNVVGRVGARGNAESNYNPPVRLFATRTSSSFRTRELLFVHVARFENNFLGGTCTYGKTVESDGHVGYVTGKG